MFLVKTELGQNVSLPCPSFIPEESGSLKVTWTKVKKDISQNEDVLMSMGLYKRTFGNYENRVFLGDLQSGDATIMLTDVSMEDVGTYRCEIMNDIEDIVQDVILEVQNDASEGKYS